MKNIIFASPILALSAWATNAIAANDDVVIGKPVDGGVWLQPSVGK